MDTSGEGTMDSMDVDSNVAEGGVSADSCRLGTSDDDPD